MKMYILYFEFVHDMGGHILWFARKLSACSYFIRSAGVHIDQYEFIIAYSLLNTTNMKFNRKSHIFILEIVKSQRHLIVILTLLCFWILIMLITLLSMGGSEDFFSKHPLC